MRREKLAQIVEVLYMYNSGTSSWPRGFHKGSPWGGGSTKARGVGQEDEGGVGGSRTRVVFVQATRHVEEKKSFSPTMGIPSGFFMGVSAICVRRQRQFRVGTDLVQCDMVTVQYKLFNFGVNKIISGVNSYNLGVNIYLTLLTWCESKLTCEWDNLV